MIIIAGPCVIDDISKTYETAEHLLKSIPIGIDFYFKSSVIKDNRTSIYKYHGLGFEKGLSILIGIKEKFHVKITTDFHSKEQIKEYGKYFDLIQIPAYLCRQNSLLEEAALSGNFIHIKKGQFLSPIEMNDVQQMIFDYGYTKKLFVSDRGTSFGYSTVVVDPRHIPLLKNTKNYVLADITHPNKNYLVQDKKLSAVLANSAIASGADGLFLETTKNENPLCDKETQLEIDHAIKIIKDAFSLYKTMKKV
jgi:2-dehydro-3-deoxyphosphooctonate aldolase (KDO 8-P synthase)